MNEEKYDDVEPDNQGSLELVIYCHDCKKIYQLNPDMIAIALCTNASIWEIYEYISGLSCNNHCSKYSNDKNCLKKEKNERT